MATTPAAIAFEGDKRIAAGALIDVAMAVRKRVAKPTHENIQVFDYTSGKTLHLDLSGTEKDIRARLAAASPATVTSPSEDSSPAAPRERSHGSASRARSRLRRFFPPSRCSRTCAPPQPLRDRTASSRGCWRR